MKIGYILLPIAFVLPAMAATLTIPSAGVTLQIEKAIDCNDGSALARAVESVQRGDVGRRSAL